MHTTTLGLRPLKPYEPVQKRVAPRYAYGRQLTLDLHLTFGPRRPPAAKPAPPARLSLDGRRLRQLLLALLEAYAGRLAPTRLRALVTPGVYRALAHRCRVAGPRYPLVTVHACQPAADVIEACGRVQAGDSARAIAARFEERGGAWVCTAFDVLRPGEHRGAGS